MNVFKEKIGPKCRGPVDISVCWTYVLAEDDPLELSSTDNWPQAPPDFDHLHGAVGVSSLSQLSSGATKDPIKSDLLLLSIDIYWVWARDRLRLAGFDRVLASYRQFNIVLST